MYLFSLLTEDDLLTAQMSMRSNPISFIRPLIDVSEICSMPTKGTITLVHSHFKGRGVLKTTLLVKDPSRKHDQMMALVVCIR